MRRFADPQMQWLRGAALGQTIYTCTYFHDHVFPGTTPSNHWSYQVLSTYVLASVKCCAMQWHELSHGRVLDVRILSTDHRERTILVIWVALTCLTAWMSMHWRPSWTRLVPSFKLIPTAPMLLFSRVCSSGKYVYALSNHRTGFCVCMRLCRRSAILWKQGLS